MPDDLLSLRSDLCWRPIPLAPKIAQFFHAHRSRYVHGSLPLTGVYLTYLPKEHHSTLRARLLTSFHFKHPITGPYRSGT